MSFSTFADGTANLPGKLLEGITLLPCTYTLNDVVHTYDGILENFNSSEFYSTLKEGGVVKTSLLNMQVFLDSFRQTLEKGTDIIYVAMASGISGTYQAAKAAAAELMEEFTERFIHIVDSRTCGLGSGMQALQSARLSSEGLSAKEASEILDEYAEHCCSYFTVDDLNFLKRTGRVSGATAAIATVLQIKPILFGTSEGNIVSCSKVRGRKKSIDSLVEKFKEKAIDIENNTVYISHGNCPEDAALLASKIREIATPKDIVICEHEPFSGAHVGPGMLGLFFYGSER